MLGILRFEYRKGNLLSSEIKKKLTQNLLKFVEDFQNNLKFIKTSDCEKVVLRNKEGKNLF